MDKAQLQLQLDSIGALIGALQNSIEINNAANEASKVQIDNLVALQNEISMQMEVS